MQTATALLTLLACCPAIACCSPPRAVPTVTAGSPRAQERADAGLRERVERFEADWGALSRLHPLPSSPRRRELLGAFLTAECAALDALDERALSLEARLDARLLETRIESHRRALEQRAEREAQVADLLPFAAGIAALEEARRVFEPLDARAAAERLAGLRLQAENARQRAAQEANRPTPVLARRAAGVVDELAGALSAWARPRRGYDPLFDWWCEQPLQRLEQELSDYAKLLREELAGEQPGADAPLIGDPIGRAALLSELELAWIPLTPEELLAIAEREWDWCQEQLRAASHELGLGEDWKAALERVKQDHVEPGRQPELVVALAREAVGFLEARELLTIPALARQTWRLEMLSTEAQLESPFFLGGEVIQVAFPTAAMTHEKKLMALRGNNRHFARATVQHELIPGHHLQQFMTARHQPHRRAFDTPFWTEGWALYWEMRLWDLGFARTPEERVGMLFWRLHRCARIRFSLGFHLGQLTPEQCVELLVEDVGHERENALAEVRRSIAGGYSPLYQCAYMIGGLQFRALQRELVPPGRMSERAFHDAVLEGGPMPVELVRARLTGQIPARGAGPAWRFDRP